MTSRVPKFKVPSGFKIVRAKKLVREVVRGTILQIRCAPAREWSLGRLAIQKAPKVLITGGGGQLGPGLARLMRASYGTDNVVLTDVRKPNNPEAYAGPFKYADVRDYNGLERLVVEHDIDWVVS